LVAAAHSAVPTAYIAIGSKRVFVRPIRSQTRPERPPPAAQPPSRRDVTLPPHPNVAAFAAGEPICSPNSAGTQFGATQLNNRPSKISNPQPSHGANSTTHW